MGGTMKCPLCGGTHPEGTTFCDVMWGDIPQEPEEEAAAGEAEGRPKPEDSGDDGRGVCPVCGGPGIPGDECWQCGGTIERLVREEQCGKVLLRLDDGPSVELELDKTFVIGREGDSPAISQMLAGYDVVSRRHCSIRLSRDATMATILDCGSTNGTFVGPEAERLDRDIACTVRLPVRIRLGSSVGITIEAEG